MFQKLLARFGLKKPQPEPEPKPEKLCHGFKRVDIEVIGRLINGYEVVKVLDLYIRLAARVGCPLLPIAIDIKAKLPDLARRYQAVRDLFFHDAVSEIERSRYSAEMDRITEEIHEARQIFRKEIDRLEASYCRDLTEVTDTTLSQIPGESSIGEELLRARSAVEAVIEVESAVRRIPSNKDPSL